MDGGWRGACPAARVLDLVRDIGIEAESAGQAPLNNGKGKCEGRKVQAAGRARPTVLPVKARRDSGKRLTGRPTQITVQALRFSGIGLESI